MMRKLLDLLKALWIDIRESFSVGGPRKFSRYDDEPETEVSSMADKPNKLRRWLRSFALWLGIIDSEDSEETTQVQPSKNKKKPSAKKRSWIWILAWLIVAALAATVVVVGISAAISSGGDNPNNTSSSSSPSSSPSHSTNAVVDNFVIDMPRRDGHRLNADGVKIKGNAEAFRKQIAEQAKHDPLTLFLYYNYSPLGRKNPIQNETDLVKDGLIKNGNVYSEEGKKRYEEWLVLWSVADIKSVREITFQGANTGVSGKTVTQSRGVTGNNKAGYDISYKDAMGNSTSGKHSALERCTQPTGGRPGIPKGPTDNAKDWRDDPYAQGNAPIGGGPNDDPGTGDYIPPDEMTHPPSTPYTAPPSPTPSTTPSSGGGGQTATPDPKPTPTPEDTGINDGEI